MLNDHGLFAEHSTDYFDTGIESMKFNVNSFDNFINKLRNMININAVIFNYDNSNVKLINGVIHGQPFLAKLNNIFLTFDINKDLGNYNSGSNTFQYQLFSINFYSILGYTDTDESYDYNRGHKATIDYLCNSYKNSVVSSFLSIYLNTSTNT